MAKVFGVYSVLRRAHNPHAVYRYKHNDIDDRGGGMSRFVNIVNVRWFSGKGSVGVVLIKTEYSGYKAYIGAALDVNEDYDAAFIVDWGAKLPRTIAAAYWPKIIKEGVMYDGKETNTRRKSRKNPVE